MDSHQPVRTVARDVDGAANLDRNPYHVYLARLSPGSRPTMAESLERIARIASSGRYPGDRFPWHQLRYQHVQAIRTALVETVSERTGKPLSPASVNKSLSALRGVLKEAWRLGLLSAEDLARATDVETVRGSVPLCSTWAPRTPSEIHARFQVLARFGVGFDSRRLHQNQPKINRLQGRFWVGATWGCSQPSLGAPLALIRVTIGR